MKLEIQRSQFNIAAQITTLILESENKNENNKKKIKEENKICTKASVTLSSSLKIVIPLRLIDLLMMPYLFLFIGLINVGSEFQIDFVDSNASPDEFIVMTKETMS